MKILETKSDGDGSIEIKISLSKKDVNTILNPGWVSEQMMRDVGDKIINICNLLKIDDKIPENATSG